jgi:uncharacterized protein YdaU (DUF1376 family)
MRYFNFHINDYFGSTGGLTPTQSFTYMKLICMYYEREQPLNLDIETFAGRNGVSVDDVNTVLRYYFQQESDGTYFHVRIENELKKMKDAGIKRSNAGKIAVNSRWDKEFLEKDFEKFWNAYPKKQNKVRALKAWIKHKPDLKVCLEALKQHVKSDQWQKNNGTFIPHASTWINGSQWEDEIASSVNNDYSRGVK